MDRPTSTDLFSQMSLPIPGLQKDDRIGHSRSNGQANRLEAKDRAFHDWYRFVLSYPPHLVRYYLNFFNLNRDDFVLDPFCGTGTTLVECKKQGIPSIGIEANPLAHFASATKINWSINPADLKEAALEIASTTNEILESQGINDSVPFEGDLDRLPLNTLDEEAQKLLITHSISPLPLHKALVLLDQIDHCKGEPYYDHLRVGLANALVYQISNLHFGPEVGIGKIKTDVSVLEAWLTEIGKITGDLLEIEDIQQIPSQAILGDSRDVGKIIPPHSIDAIITSPPYPNEKDYTRTTRLESVLLGFIRTKSELRKYKGDLVRSNTRGVYVTDSDEQWVANHAEVQRIAALIEQRRLEMGKNSGFEKLYAKVTRLYFGGMARHLYELRGVLKPGAKLAYVVGDQASYLRVMIRTGEILADIAQNMGYEVLQIDLFRTRFASASKEQLREEVVCLKWPGE
jgi:DNA modification methylase